MIHKKRGPTAFSYTKRLCKKLAFLMLVFYFIAQPMAVIFAQEAEQTSRQFSITPTTAFPHEDVLEATPLGGSIHPVANNVEALIVDAGQNTEIIRPDAVDVANGRASYGDNATATNDPSPVVYTPEAANGATPAKHKPQTDLSTGALTYGVPIDLPPGRNGLTPNLSISYNNQAEQLPSYFGDKWSISIPYIQRLNKTGTEKMYDTNNFTSSTGGELVQVGATNSYLQKIDNGENLKYNFDGSVWTVTDISGTVFTYGATAQARQDNSDDNTKIYKWMLDSVTDANGNTIKYFYFKDKGEIYPDKINYGGNGSAAGIFDVVFSREQYAGGEYTDGPFVYYPSFKVKTDYRIKNITVSVNNEWVKKYDLGYTVGDAAFRILLASVTASGRVPSTNTTTTLPAEKFEYKKRGDIGWEATQTTNYILPYKNWIKSGREPGMTQMQDLNGDTYPDVASYSVGESSYVYMNNTVDGWDTSHSLGLPMPFRQDNVYFRDYGTRIVDVNGDMRNDFIKSYSKLGADSTPAVSKVYLENKNNASWTEDPNISIPTSIIFGDGANADNGVRIVDVNGDGLPDIIRSYLYETIDSDTNYKPARLIQKVYLGTGSGWQEAPVGTWNIPFPIMDQNPDGPEMYTYMEIMDLNGDHLPDLLWRLPQPGYVMSWWPQNVGDHFTLINNGHGWDGVPDQMWQTPRTIGTEYSGSYTRYGYTDAGLRDMDMNGDNFPDLFKSVTNNGSVQGTILMNPGTGEQIEIDSSAGEPTSSFRRQSYNGAPEEFANTNGASNSRLMISDVNADGMDDMLVAETSNTDTFRTSLGKPNNFTDTLTKITLPQGGTYSIDYQRSNKYRKADNTLSNPNLPIVIDTVKKIMESDSVGSVTSSTTNDYADGNYFYNSPSDRKFAGFKKMTTTDAAGNTTTTYFHQGDSSDSALGESNDDEWKIGKPYRVEVADSSGKIISKTINKWEDVDRGNGSKFVRIAQSMTSSMDSNTHKDTAESYIYDDSTGNVTQKTEYGEVSGNDDGTFTDVGTDKFVTNYNYASANSGVQSSVSSETTFDQNNNKVKETKYYYDNLPLGQISRGNMTKQEKWKSGATYINTQKTYNNFGLVTSDIDANGNTTAYTYDNFNLYPSSTTNALGQTTNFTYDYASGQAIQKIDANNRIFQTKYDGFGRILSELQPDLNSPSTLVAKSSYSYTDTPNSFVVSKTDYLDSSLSTDSRIYFDGFGRKIQERKQSENGYNVKDYIYNQLGQLQKESLPYSGNGSSKTAPTTNSALYSSYIYDPLGRILSTTNAAGTTTNIYENWKVTVTDPNGKIKSLYKDAYGNLIQVDEQNAGQTYSTNYNYNYLGNLTKITDAMGNIRNFTYDGLGRRISAQDLHAVGDNTFGTYTYSYDNNGNLLQKIDPKNQTVNYTYDALNRPKTENFTGTVGTEITNTYDAGVDGIGRLASVATNSITTDYVYNALGAVKTETKTIDAVPYVTSYDYDRQGNQTMITNPDSSQIKYTYNTAGLLEKVQRKESAGSLADVVTNFDYSPTGQITTENFANGVTTTNTYDQNQLYRLQRKLTTKPDQGGTKKIQDLNYAYDRVGNITQINDQSDLNTRKTTLYTYDDLYRLTWARTLHGASGKNYSQTYQYDPIGNITYKSDVGTYIYGGDSGSSYANPHAVTKIVNSEGVAKNFSYDKNGEVLGGTTGQNYTWDYNGQMKTAATANGTATYSYDAAGGRIKTQTPISTAIYPTMYFNITDGKTIKHIFGNGTDLGTVYGSGANVPMIASHTDNLNGITATTSMPVSGDPAITEIIDYYPFGAINFDSPDIRYKEQRKFIGQQYDVDTGLSYLNARYYDGTRGQFVSEDPQFWNFDQSWLLDPQNQNSYSYARNNPITLSDPSGESVWSTGIGAIKSIWKVFSSLTTIPTAYAPIISPEVKKVTQETKPGVHDVSEEGLEFIAKKEKLVPVVSPDPIGIPTVGYGHVVLPGEVFKGELTKEQAMDLLKQDSKTAVDKVNKYINVPLNQNQFDALTSFAFNVGLSSRATPSLIKTVNSGTTNPALILNTFLRYNFAGGKILDGLTNRRAAEAKLYLYAKYK